MISEIYYEQIDPQIASPMEMARFYYLYNLIGVSDIFEEAYINHEIKQLSIRNNVIRTAMRAGRMPNHPKIDTTMLGISPLYNKSVLIVDVSKEEEE